MTDSTALARIESTVINLRGKVDELHSEQKRQWKEMSPILMERSGDAERMKFLERELLVLTSKSAQLEQKIEGNETRWSAKASELEKRQDRAWWMVVGAFAILQALWIILGPAIQAAIKIGAQ